MVGVDLGGMLAELAHRVDGTVVVGPPDSEAPVGAVGVQLGRDEELAEEQVLPDLGTEEPVPLGIEEVQAPLGVGQADLVQVVKHFVTSMLVGCTLCGPAVKGTNRTVPRPW